MTTAIANISTLDRPPATHPAVDHPIVSRDQWLADLFDGRHQLVMQHFMLAPGWEQGCKSCSYMADHTDATLVHLAQRDTAFVAVSRAPLSEIERFRKRMGWKFPWVSSHS